MDRQRVAPFARVPYVPVCGLLGLVLGWLPWLLHGPIPATSSVLYIRGDIAVWAYYSARRLIGFVVGATVWPARWWLRGPLMGFLVRSFSQPGGESTRMSVSRASLAALVLLAMGTAIPDAPDGVDEITDCIKANQPKLSTEQEVSFRVVDRLGSARVSNAKIYWQKTGDRTHALVRFTAPSDLRGSALLLIEKGERSDMFMYLPELRKVRRISDRTVAGSMFGTDFSYEDFERIQGLAADSETKRLPDGEVEGRATFVLEGRPARGEESAYERVVAYVDQEHCVPLRTEFYEQGDRLRKVMLAPFEKLSQHGSLWVPRLILVRDVLDETQTELIVEEVEFDKKLPRKLFSERELVAGAR